LKYIVTTMPKNWLNTGIDLLYTQFGAITTSRRFRSQEKAPGAKSRGPDQGTATHIGFVNQPGKPGAHTARKCIPPFQYCRQGRERGGAAPATRFSGFPAGRDPQGLWRQIPQTSEVGAALPRSRLCRPGLGKGERKGALTAATLRLIVKPWQAGNGSK
jgi:hypothetical protein